MDFAPYQDVYSNLLASAIWTLGARVSSAAGVARPTVPDDVRTRYGGRALAFNKAVAELALPQKMREDLGGERLRSFFLSSEARDIALGIAVATISESDVLDIELRRRFLATLSWYTRLSEDDLAQHADRFYDSIASDVQTVLERDDRTLENSVVLERFADDLISASNGATMMLAKRTPSFPAVFDFEARYRTAVADRYGRIEPPNHEGSTIPRHHLYVEPRFQGSEEAHPIESQVIRDTIHRTVVLGNPGAGKSSFARAVCHAYAHRLGDAARGFATPILIELREYAAEKETHGFSLPDYIGWMINKSFQIRPPADAVEYLLNSGRAMIVFDGLDELIETHDRKAIRDDVDTFAVLYPFTRILVTSRERGYREAALDDRRFSVIHMNQFDQKQVEEYATKWFALDESFSPDERAERAEAFLTESSSVGDLRSNALMLALMCGIYKRQNHIPRNRAAVYEECANMLFDRWDRAREIAVDRPLDTHLHALLQHIAQWIFGNQQLQAGATHDELTDHVSLYFEQEIAEDKIVARSLADRFVRFCHGRGWVLVASGRDQDGQELYEFAHRTFLEFFTAGWYASSDLTLDEFADLMLSKVEQGEWEMVALLAAQVRNRGIRNSATQLLDALVLRVERTNDRRLRANLLSFASRIYEFHVPRAITSRRLAALAMDDHIAIAQQPTDSPLLSVTSRTLSRLLSCDVEGRRPITDAFAERLIAAGKAPEIDITIPLDCALHPATELPIVSSAGEYAEVQDRFWQQFESRLRALAPRNLQICLSLYLKDLVSTEDLVRWHGVGSLFRQCTHPARYRTQSWPPAAALVNHALVDQSELSQDAARRLVSIGEVLISTPAPWASREFAASTRWLQYATVAVPTSGEAFAVGLILTLVLDELVPGRWITTWSGQGVLAKAMSLLAEGGPAPTLDISAELQTLLDSVAEDPRAFVDG